VAAPAADPVHLLVDGIRSMLDRPPLTAEGVPSRPTHDAMAASVRDDLGARTVVLLSVDVRDGGVVATGPDVDRTTSAWLRHLVRHPAHPDRFLGGFLIGGTAVTTAARAMGSAAWAASPLRHGCRERLGVDQLLGVPLARGGTQVDVLLLGRRGADFSAATVEAATRVQPGLRDAYRLTDQSLGPTTAGPSGRSSPPHPASTGAEVRVVVLTPREREVLDALGTGRTAYAIAAVVGCSERTVHRHLQSIYRKLGTHDRRVTVSRARELRLI
jgi:DNA-binding CsgD family transcriptional regulator